MKISEDYLPEEVFGNYIIFPVGKALDSGEKVLKLNQTGFVIVSNLLEEKTFEELINELVIQFEASEDEIEDLEKEVESFLKILINKQMLTNL